MSKLQRLSAAELDQLLTNTRFGKSLARSILHAVMVDGEAQVSVAARHEVTRQYVSKLLNEFREHSKVLSDNSSALALSSLLLPPALAQELVQWQAAWVSCPDDEKKHAILQSLCLAVQQSARSLA